MPSAPWKAYCNTFLGEISSLSFDPYTDLLWTANPSGTVVSHFLPTTTLPPSDQDRRITRYTSFKSHTYRSPSTELLLAERGVLSLADKSLKFTNRRGIPYWFLSTAFQDACSMAFTAPKSAELIIGGAKPELVLLNASTGALVRRIDISQSGKSTLNSAQPSTGFSPTTHLRRSQSLICCGARSGTVTLRDPVTLKEEHSMMTHYAGLEQMETEGNYLVTCGYSLKQGHPVRDPLVKVFDVRALRPLAPITFSSSPAHVRFHPRMSSTLFITSSTGQLQIIDLAHPIPNSSFYQLDVGTFITDMCISSSGDGLAYAEADGVVHLWTTAVGEMDLGDESVRSNTKPIKWSRGNMPIALPDSVEESAPVQWTDETPLSSIGMPYYSTELFSVLPSENYITPYSPLYQRRALPDTDLSVRASHHQSSNTTHEVFDGGGQKFEVQYISNPKKTKRYQASLPTQPIVSSSGRSATARVGSPSQNLGQLIPNSKRKLSIPLFRSEKEKEKAKTLGRGKAHMEANLVGNESERDDEISFDMSLDDFHEMPKWYRQVEIKYSKFGIEDFDFGFYNNTQYSGLETHIVNSYTNSLLQVLYHTLPVRKVAESHIALSCTTQNCMLCELGFLFKMLDDAQGVNCQTSNFSRAFSINQRAIALELMDHQHQEFCLHQSQIMPRLGDQSTNTQKIPISSKSYSSLIQLCHHFLLDQIAEDASKISTDYPFESLRSHPINTQIRTTNSTTSVATISNHLLPSPIGDIYTTRWQTTQSCPSCHHQISRTSFTKVIEMTYPRKALSNEPKPSTDFCSILKNSMIRETTAKSLCSNCNQYTHQRWRRQPDDLGAGNKALPTVLALNTGVTNSEQFEIWLDRRAKSAFVSSSSTKPANLEDDSSSVNEHFLQPEIGISIEPLPDLPQETNTSSSCRISIGDNHPIKIPQNAVIYELRGLIVQIQSDDETPHLVSLIKVNNHHKITSPSTTSTTLNLDDKPQSENGAGAGAWYLFNDFLVKKVSQEEALSFPACWKVPCVLYYVRKDFDEVLDFTKLPANTVDKSILLKEINLSKCRDVNKIRHEVLKEDELPKKGDLVAIDAEFVSLQQEEVDYKSDGTRLVRRPSQMTLARVSVLRGEGSKTGVPFIDDHIQTFEPIADYLTEFSGIRRMFNFFFACFCREGSFKN
ncbi:poly(A)-specific ribonuclease [Puccinia graminis f. sp. tritici]|uniref:Poly(A)-specific ribonuclease n=1 Tax=Puccinia graminis f. sp. tritici TaxID=56615 RepID=A0A5B0S0F6_PUCGR|nr:poly(A)-specific ribonuclease [Puccinia graminis f. sp. tritici]